MFLRTHLYHFLVTLQFLTRLPVPTDLNPSVDDLSKTGLYFPLVGVLLGLLGWLVFKSFDLMGIEKELNIILSIAAVMLLTGGFHEDGLADTFDGFGSAFAIEKKLQIMKDSRLGTYGALALIIALSIRYTSLVSTQNILIVLVLSLMAGRLSSICIIPFTDYAEMDEASKSKPIIMGIVKTNVKIPLAYSVLITLMLVGPLNTLLLYAILALVCIVGRYISLKQVNGITGDVLGAINIVCELSVLVFISSIGI